MYNITDSNDSHKHYHYYDADTGFLLKADNPIDLLWMELESTSAVIAEFPVFMLPILILAIPLTIKYSKFLTKKS